MMLKQLTKFLAEKTMINVHVYYTFVYPHLLYGLEFWGAFLQGSITPNSSLSKESFASYFKKVSKFNDLI